MECSALQAVRTLRGVQRYGCCKVPGGSQRSSALLGGSVFTWLTFDESGKPLPEAGLSQILLDEQSLGGDLEASYAIIGTFASRQNPKPLIDWSSSVTNAAKSLAGHRGVRSSLSGQIFTWLTFDESRKPLPEAGLSQILLDEQFLGGDLEKPATSSLAALQAIRTLSP